MRRETKTLPRVEQPCRPSDRATERPSDRPSGYPRAAGDGADGGGGNSGDEAARTGLTRSATAPITPSDPTVAPNTHTAAHRPDEYSNAATADPVAPPAK
jgi:hypothetical protein